MPGKGTRASWVFGGYGTGVSGPIGVRASGGVRDTCAAVAVQPSGAGGAERQPREGVDLGGVCVPGHLCHSS
ncbi:hypothetical protein Lfu02_72610 [Longispora fulva]|nr:hypothetical protein Lfu02_72610 [Longispora fulva]